MIFYDCSTAPNPRRARMVLAEKGLRPETHEVSIAKGEQMQPEFLKINPLGTIPVLVTDAGTTLSENLGIAAYLDAAHPEPPMMGRTADEKGLVLTWNAIAEQHGGLPVAEVLRNTHPAFKNHALPGPLALPQIPELAERGTARLGRFFDILEERLEGRAFLATDDFTFADISAYVFVDFARVIKARIPEGNRATLDWFERIKERPSSQI